MPQSKFFHLYLAGRFVCKENTEGRRQISKYMTLTIIYKPSLIYILSTMFKLGGTLNFSCNHYKEYTENLNYMYMYKSTNIFKTNNAFKYMVGENSVFTFA